MNELQANIQIFSEYVNKTEEERASIINTGMFNSFIEAYLIATLEDMGKDAEEIEEAKRTLKSILDTTSAMEVKTRNKQ